MYDTSVVKCIWCLDDVGEILEPACGHLRLTMHTIFCRNVISIEYMASTVIVFFFFNCNYKFQHTRLCSFQNLILSFRVILNIFLIFVQISPLMFLFNQFLYKKSVGEELVYRGRDFNLLPFFLSGPHWIPLPIGEVRAEDMSTSGWMSV